MAYDFAEELKSMFGKFGDTPKPEYGKYGPPTPTFELKNVDEITNAVYTMVRGMTDELKLRPTTGGRFAICNKSKEVIHSSDDVQEAKRLLILMVIGEYE